MKKQLTQLEKDAIKKELHEQEKLKNSNPIYTIYKCKDGWTAVEKHPDRMEFMGYGNSPESALKDISRSHDSFVFAIKNC